MSTEATRDTTTRLIVKKYQNGQSIRAIAAELGRSYGFVHKILTQADVTLRPRGGAHGRKPKATITPEERPTP